MSIVVLSLVCRLVLVQLFLQLTQVTLVLFLSLNKWLLLEFLMLSLAWLDLVHQLLHLYPEVLEFSIFKVDEFIEPCLVFLKLSNLLLRLLVLPYGVLLIALHLILEIIDVDLELLLNGNVISNIGLVLLHLFFVPYLRSWLIEHGVGSQRWRALVVIAVAVQWWELAGVIQSISF